MNITTTTIAPCPDAADCPRCGWKIATDGALGSFGQLTLRGPRAGDVCVCHECTLVLRATEDGFRAVRPITVAEFHQELSPGQRAIVLAVAKEIGSRNRREGKPSEQKARRERAS